MSLGKFAAKFILFFIMLYLLFHALDVSVLQTGTASMSGSIAGTLGKEAIIDGTTISVEGNRFNVVAACTGIDSIAMLLALCLADDRLFRKSKVLLGISGSAALLLWNSARVGISMTSSNPDSMHFSLWFVSLLIIIGMWIMFLRAQDKTLN